MFRNTVLDILCSLYYPTYTASHTHNTTLIYLPLPFLSCLNQFLLLHHSIHSPHHSNIILPTHHTLLVPPVPPPRSLTSPSSSRTTLLPRPWTQMPSFLVICGTVRKRRQPRRTIHSGNKYLILEMTPNSVPFYFFCSVVYCTYHVLLSVNKTNFVEILDISFLSFCITNRRPAHIGILETLKSPLMTLMARESVQL